MPISLWAPLLPILIAATPPAMDLQAHDPQAASAGPAVLATAGPDWQLPVEGKVIRPFDPPATPWSRGHRGVDLAVRPAALIRVAGSGTVIFTGTLAGRGVVSIEHTPGMRTTYEPVRALVRRGAQVRTGQVIGVHAPDRHHPTTLHWGLRIRGGYADPLRLVHRSVILKPIGEEPRSGGLVHARCDRDPQLPWGENVRNVADLS